jgi:hypothetical protein
MDKTQESIFDLQLDEECKRHLLETSKWGKLLSVVGIIGGALIMLAGIVVMIAGQAMSSMASLGGFAWLIGLVYVVLGAICLFPSFKLLRFSSNMPAGIHKTDQALVVSGFANLKSCFKVWGIMTLVMIGLYVAVLAGAAIFGSMF